MKGCRKRGQEGGEEVGKGDSDDGRGRERRRVAGDSRRGGFSCTGGGNAG